MSDDTERDLIDKFYGSDDSLISSFEGMLRDDVDRLTDAKGWDAAQRREHILMFGRAIEDAAIERPLAPKLHAVLTRHAITPADDATHEQWVRESRQALRVRYGLEESARRIAATKTFLEARPKLHEMLNRAGVADHPDIVAALTESPHRHRVQPRQPKKPATVAK